jgi:hypothetical protein
VTSDTVEPNSAMDQMGRSGNTHYGKEAGKQWEICFLDRFLYLSFFFSRREGSKETVRDRVRGCWLHRSDH